MPEAEESNDEEMDLSSQSEHEEEQKVLQKVKVQKVPKRSQKKISKTV